MLELLQLDVRTLAFVSGLGGWLMAITMAGIYLAGRRERELIYWALAGVIFGSGYFVGHLVLTLPLTDYVPGWLAVTMANALIGLGYGLILLGVQGHLGRTRSYGVVGLIFGFMLVVMPLAPALSDSLRMRVIFISGIYVLLGGWAGALLWNARDESLRLFRRGVALVLLINAAFLLIRIIYAIATTALTTSFVQDDMQLAAMLVTTVFSFSVSIALALLMFRKNEADLHDLARRDSLTGLLNRQGMEDSLGATPVDNRKLAMIMFDIDRFKRLNDSFGHAAGDAVLAQIGQRTQDVLRGGDLAVRMGGEEFLILLPQTGLQRATEVAERLRCDLEAQQVESRGALLSVTASYGVVELTDGEDLEDGIRRADKALYEAKAQGRNCVVSH